ncbi:PREDICTED: uncharacterized protein LOC108967088 [Bactrocera latifrons]|uniref:HTH CENPB-type domain-containing protein n=1 Tax=Bactrocera latifrons TaxID=174628 RepID=A0A0K8UAS2_BACLA|nr:PREDICTED: uncharacterized protein LOC108967088 [Bactrocera latifrons]
MELLNAKHRDYKTRNILTTAERIQVIKAYKRMPNYQRLASTFGCSAKQIKNIISNKDQLLRHYDSVRANKLTDEVTNRRQEKIDFLGKVVYEFLLRALYLRMPIGTTIIRQKAFEVKEAIAIENFSPNNVWLRDFKATYNRLDLASMMEHLPSDMDQRRSLKCIDIIEYVSEQEREERRKILTMTKDENCNSVWESDADGSNSSCSYEHTMTNSDTDMKSNDDDSVVGKNIEPIVVNLASDDEEEGSDDVSLAKAKSINTPANQSISTQKPITLPPFPDIHSYPEALRHLRVLEDFAMIEENYRAIGLITQLEQIFKNPPKLKSLTH